MTALTTNGSAVAASTLAAAGKLFNATGGSSGNTSTKVGSGTLFKQLFAKGTTTNQTGVASIPLPTDSNFNGWMWDVTTLEGQLLQAGTLTPTIHLLASTGTTVTPTVQWFKRTSGGVYSQLATVAGSSIALTTSSQALTFTPPSMADTPFATGDKLVMWLWVNQTAGGATNSTISVVEATSASTAGVASEVQTVTQGYIPIVTTTYSFTDSLIVSDGSSAYKTTVLADSPIRYYRLDDPSGTTVTDLGSQAQNATIQNPSGVTLGTTSLLANDSDASMTFVSASTGYISLPTTGLPAGASAWSVECLAKLASLPGAGNYLVAWSLGTKAANTVAEVYHDGDVTQWTFDTDQDAIFSATIAANTTYHLMMTYDGTSYKAYVNGALIGSRTHTLALAYGEADIGRDGQGFYFNGIADELAIYSTTLAAQVSQHYAAGVITPFTSPATLVCAFTESLTASDSLLKTDTVLPTESLTATESLLITGGALPSDALSTSESMNGTGTVLPADGLTATDSLLGTDTGLPVESLTTSDFGNLQSWPLDTLTITESLLITGMSSATDALTTSESALWMESASLTEANSASDAFLASSTVLPTESLSISDASLDSNGYTSLDSLVVSDMQALSGTYLPLEGLTGTSSPLEWDIYVPIDDALGGSDSFTSSEDSAGSTTTAYSFEDDLLITEGLLVVENPLLLDLLSIAENMRGTESTGTIEGLSVSDGLLNGQETDSVDGLNAQVGIAGTGGYSPVEQTSILESLLFTSSVLPLDALAANESLLSVDMLSLEEDVTITESVTITVIPFYPFFELLSATSLLLTDEEVTGDEQGRVSDAFTARMWFWNAVVLVRSGAGEFRVRGGQATVLVRSGEAELLVRSGKATILIEED